MKTLEELMLYALKIEEPIEICWPNRGNIRETVNPADYRFYNCCYSTSNNTIAFVYGNLLYVLPYSTKAEKIILENEFKKKHFYVPLQYGSYPVEYKEKWEKMLKEASDNTLLDWIDKCIICSNQKGYGTIKKELLEKYCLEIPKKGIKVRKLDGRIFTHYPAIKSMHNSIAMNKIGKYFIRNGVCAFIYRDSKTYVTCSSIIIEALKKIGYKEECLWVPLSNREEIILDSDYAKKWEKISTLP